MIKINAYQYLRRYKSGPMHCDSICTVSKQSIQTGFAGIIKTEQYYFILGFRFLMKPFSNKIFQLLKHYFCCFQVL